MLECWIDINLILLMLNIFTMGTSICFSNTLSGLLICCLVSNVHLTINRTYFNATPLNVNVKNKGEVLCNHVFNSIVNYEYLTPNATIKTRKVQTKTTTFSLQLAKY